MTSSTAIGESLLDLRSCRRSNNTGHVFSIPAKVRFVLLDGGLGFLQRHSRSRGVAGLLRLRHELLAVVRATARDRKSLRGHPSIARGTPLTGAGSRASRTPR
jgi:hypothetical protein